MGLIYNKPFNTHKYTKKSSADRSLCIDIAENDLLNGHLRLELFFRDGNVNLANLINPITDRLKGFYNRGYKINFEDFLLGFSGLRSYLDTNNWYELYHYDTRGIYRFFYGAYKYLNFAPLKEEEDKETFVREKIFPLIENIANGITANL